MKKNSRIKKLFTTSLLIAIAFLGVHSTTPNVAEARYSDLTIAEERVLAQEHLRNAYRELEGKDYRDENAIRIYHEIVEANPTRMWFNDGKHPYYLQELRCIDSYSGKMDAFNAGDGIICITRRYIGECSGYATCAVSVNGKGKHKIYNNAIIASALAHEIGHWEDKTLKSSRTTEESIQAERIADRLALEYMDGTLFYGYGGCLIDNATRFVDDSEAKDDETHPLPSARANMVSNYITNASKNRLKFDKEYRVTLDGKLFNGTGYAPDYDIGGRWPEIEANERTMYVAGQIAFAIKYGVWNKHDLMMQTQQSLFGCGGDTVVLSVRNPKSPEPNGCKVIDKFNISYQRASDIIKVVVNHGNVNQLGSLNQEEKYFAELLKTIS